MDLQTALKQFEEIQGKIHAFSHAMSMIYFDGVTVAPPNTEGGRRETLGTLSRYVYDLTAGAETREVLVCLKAHESELTDVQKRQLTVFNRENEFTASIPPEEYVEFRRLTSEADSVWHKAKAGNDFKAFAPYLKKIFEMNRRFALYYKPDQKPYDTLLDQYERGLTMETCDRFFAALRGAIVPLLRDVTGARQVDDPLAGKRFPVELQRKFSDYLMETIRIDRDHCNIGETEHPFTINFNREDVRITTHYHEDGFFSSMFSVIHEGGHALYELGSGEEYENTCLAGGVSMAVHESQSRFFENLIGRSESYIALIDPKLRELFPAQMEGVSAHALYLAANRVEPSLIRTEADELTYCLHVMVRYDLEKAVIAGELDTDDLPAAWNAKYKEYLGVDVPDDTRGVLQDSHWSGGSVGYFPSYALGSAYGAQILAKMRETLDVDALAAAGNLQPVTDWLRERIWRHSCRYDPAELFRMCCEADFDPKFFTDYLETKFRKIYGV